MRFFALKAATEKKVPGGERFAISGTLAPTVCFCIEEVLVSREVPAECVADVPGFAIPPPIAPFFVLECVRADADGTWRIEGTNVDSEPHFFRADILVRERVA